MPHLSKLDAAARVKWFMAAAQHSLAFMHAERLRRLRSEIMERACGCRSGRATITVRCENSTAARARATESTRMSLAESSCASLMSLCGCESSRALPVILATRTIRHTVHIARENFFITSVSECVLQPMLKASSRPIPSTIFEMASTQAVACTSGIARCMPSQ